MENESYAVQETPNRKGRDREFQQFLSFSLRYTMFEDAEVLSDLMLADNEIIAKYIEENLEGRIPGKYNQPQGRIQ